MNVTKLILRETIMDDCPFFAKWETDESVIKYFSISKGRTLEDIKQELKDRRSSKNEFDFTVVREIDNVPVGRIYVSRYDNVNKSLDITRIYIGDKENRGKGLGEGALRLILEHAFNKLKVHRVTLDHFDGNVVAVNLYKKIGFRYEGIARDACIKDGLYYDLHLMSLLENEY
ncbi:MAG: GNAT family protein [Anaerovoracaceae bacterium]